MTKLSTLRISNIRRFANDVSFNFSPAANIILAPNGTGKTSMFEAIELALTGSIARLDGNLSAAIRENTNSAGAQVTFGENNKSVKIYQDQKESVHQGVTVEQIFGLKEGADLPYLLRLTHLLDQRDRDWFVQADAKEAGAQLARLPLTRDSAVAFGTTNAAKRIARDGFNTNIRELREASERLKNWEDLLAERDRSAHELERDLRSPGVVAENIQPIAVELLGTSLFESPVSTSYLRTTCLDALAVANERIQSTTTNLANTREARVLIEHFSSANHQLKRISVDRNNLTAVLATAREQQEKIEARIQDQYRVELDLGNKRIENATCLEKLNEYAMSGERLSGMREVLSNESQIVFETESKLQASRTERQRVIDLKQHRDTLEARLQSIVASQSKTIEALGLVGNWEQSEHRMALLTKAHDEDAVQAASVEVLQQQVSELEIRQAQFTYERKRLVDELIASSNAIRTAVLTIASQLPSDVEDCPVCGVHHGNKELRDRLQKTLEAANPLLGAADAAYRSALSELENIRKKKEALNATAQELRSRSSQQAEEMGRLTMYVATIRSNVEISGDTPLAARVLLQVKVNTLAESKSAVEDEMSRAATMAELAKLPDLEVDVDSLSRALELARSRRLEADRAVATELAVFSELESLVRELPSLESLRARNAELGTEAIEVSRTGQEIVEMQVKNSNAIEELVVQLRRMDEAFAAARRELTKIAESWGAAGLVGEPSTTTADVVTAQQESALSVLRLQDSTLRRALSDLDRLSTAEHNRKAQDQIDVYRGSNSEAEMTASLQSVAKYKRIESNAAEKVVDALDALSQSLSVQMGDIHDRVIRVVPTWQALLKRIVRDQRFSETTLDFYSHYNKERAEIKVPLGKKQFPAPLIASEAQLTDVQLCFLLSLALGQTWSPWKGLLLDDPTQHHDLVHAAAVFDVLRDFIFEHDFQLILATHDSLQARYLMRKLENDGIDARLWTLIPTEGGVRAVASN